MSLVSVGAHFGKCGGSRGDEGVGSVVRGLA